MNGTRSNTDSEKWLKSGEDTGVVIESGSGLNYQVEFQDPIHSQIQSQERDNLPTYQCGSQ